MNDEKTELLKFQFTIEDQSFFEKVSFNELYTNLSLIKKISQIFDVNKKIIKNPYELKIFDYNNFLVYSMIEIFSIDAQGNYVKYNLIELVFDEKLLSFDKMNEFYLNNNDSEIFLFAELDRKYCSMKKEDCEIITLIYIFYHLAKIFISSLYKAESLSNLNCLKLKFILESFRKFLKIFNFNCKKIDKKFFLYLKYKTSTFANFNKDLVRRIENLGKMFSKNGKEFNLFSQILYVINDIEILEEKKVYSKYIFYEKLLFESIKLNSDCVYIAIKDILNFLIK